MFLGGKCAGLPGGNPEFESCQSLEEILFSGAS